MELINALGLVQQELKAPKSCYNDFSNYPYRNAEAIILAVKPLLKEFGLVLIMSDDMVNLGDRFYIKATARLFLGEKSIEASAFAREELSLKGQIAAQISGGCSSYARKYALCGLFCIDGEADPDSGNHQEAEEVNNAPSKGEVNWYNSFDSQKGQMIAKIRSGEQTAEGIIQALKTAGYAISKDNQAKIKGLK